MLAKEIDAALNDQIKWELYSGYMYLSMASYFEETGLMGFAHWMKMQAQEELYHAMKMLEYTNEAGGRVLLQGIDQPPHTWESALDVIESGLKHEQEVTRRINELVDLAIQHKDHATQAFLQWFVTEQVEEEASFGEVRDKVKLAGECGGMFMLDRDMANRTFTWPSAGE
jgi:ferritin